MDDACMKTAVKSGLWLLITTWLLMIVFALSVKYINAGLTSLFLSFCCIDGFNIIETFKAVFWVCIFNIVLSIIFLIQTTEQ